MARPPIVFTCQACGSTQTRVIDARGSWEADEARRTRVCLICQHRFTTKELVEAQEQDKNKSSRGY